MVAFSSPRRGDPGARVEWTKRRERLVSAPVAPSPVPDRRMRGGIRAADCLREPCPFTHVRETFGKDSALPGKHSFRRPNAVADALTSRASSRGGRPFHKPRTALYQGLRAPPR